MLTSSFLVFLGPAHDTTALGPASADDMQSLDGSMRALGITPDYHAICPAEGDNRDTLTRVLVLMSSAGFSAVVGPIKGQHVNHINYQSVQV